MKYGGHKFCIIIRRVSVLRLLLDPNVEPNDAAAGALKSVRLEVDREMKISLQITAIYCDAILLRSDCAAKHNCCCLATMHTVLMRTEISTIWLRAIWNPVLSWLFAECENNGISIIGYLLAGNFVHGDNLLSRYKMSRILLTLVSFVRVNSYNRNSQICIER